MHLQHGMDTLCKYSVLKTCHPLRGHTDHTEMLLFLVAIHLKGFLQEGSGQISGTQEPLLIHTEQHIRETVTSALFEPMSSLEHLEVSSSHLKINTNHSWVIP